MVSSILAVPDNFNFVGDINGFITDKKSVLCDRYPNNAS